MRMFGFLVCISILRVILWFEVRANIKLNGRICGSTKCQPFGDGALTARRLAESALNEAVAMRRR